MIKRVMSRPMMVITSVLVVLAVAGTAVFVLIKNINAQNWAVAGIMCVALITLVGVFLTFSISVYNSTKIELRKVELSGGLYSKRLDAYLEIFNLVSGFIKTIERKEGAHEKLNDFYREYSFLDSKSGLLFNLDTAGASRTLMQEIGKVLPNDKDWDEALSEKMRKLLNQVEICMKNELGAFGYTETLDSLETAKKYKELSLSTGN